MREEERRGGKGREEKMREEEKRGEGRRTEEREGEILWHSCRWVTPEGSRRGPLILGLQKTTTTRTTLPSSSLTETLALKSLTLYSFVTINNLKNGL